MKKLGLILALLIMTSGTAYADKLYFNDSRKIDYSAIVKATNKEVVLNVLNGGFKFDSSTWLSGDATNIVYSGSAVSDENNNVSFKFVLPAAGKYNAELNFGDSKQSENLVFIVKSDFENSIDALNAGKNDEAIVSNILNSNRAELGLWFDLYDSQNKESVAKILKNTLIKSELSKSDYEGSHNMIERCFIIDALNKGANIPLNEYRKSLGLSDKVLNDFWIEAHADEVATRISKKNYSDCDAIDNDLNEAVALVKIKYADGFGEVKDVINYFGSKIGITNISDTVARTIMGNSYENFSKLLPSINSASNANKTSSSSSTSFTSSNTPPIKIEYNTSEQKGNPEKLKRFIDLEGYDWVSNEIEELAIKGIINGKTYNTFCPSHLITREEFVSLIVTEFNIQVIGDEMEFTDVNEDSWYYKAVERAFNSGIISGFSGSEFGSGKNITRQDLAVIVYRTLKLCNVEFKNAGENTGFLDDMEIAEYAKEAVWQLKDKGIMVGNNNMFNPNSNTTRAEAAKVIHSLLTYSERGIVK